MPRPSFLAEAGPALPAGDRQLVVTLIGQGPAGARLITSPDSALVVGAARAGELALLLARPPFRARPLTYLLLASAGPDLARAELKVGESLDPKARLAVHFRTPPVPADEVLLIGSYHESYGKDALLALQHALTEQAVRAGRCRVVGAPPQISWLQRVNAAQLERWLGELRPMLVAGGCTLLEPHGPRLRLRVAVGTETEAMVQYAEPDLPQPVPAMLSGYRLDLPEGLLGRPDAQRYTLAWGAVRAEAAQIGGWTILRQGSLVAGTDTPGIQGCLARKRRTLLQAGILKASARRGLWRIEQDVALPSLTNATRLVTGTNGPGTLWRAA